MRRLAAAAVILLIGSCGPSDGPTTDTASPRSTPRASRIPQISRSGSPTPGSTPSIPTATATPPSTTDPEEHTPRPSPAPALDDYGGVGDLAMPYLRRDHPRLVVEITAVEDRAPTPRVRDLLAARLRDVLDKPSGVDVLDPRIIPPQGTRHDLDEIRAVEETHRTRFSGGDEVVMHYLFLDGGYAEDEGALGVAYRASSVVVFPDTIQRASTALVPPDAIERSVLVHEAGHLLRLVNIGYRSPRDHEDREHPNHTKHQDGVMYWAVESVSVTNILSGGPPDDFHPDSRADLRDLKSGRITPDG